MVHILEDLGNAEHILGMRINRNRKDKLSQEKYIEKVLNKFNMAEAKSSLGVPLSSYVKLSKAIVQRMRWKSML